MGKRLAETLKLVEKNRLYALEEAVDLVKQTAKAKFDETVEIHIRLGIDPKKGDQIVRGNIALPHGIGKSRKVAVVAQGEKVKEAEAAGADFSGSDDLIAKIQDGWMDFDVLVATPDSMKNLSKLGKTLGPKGLMPNPRAGTVTFDIATAVKELKAGRVEYKNDSYGIIHSPIGKASFDKDKLFENAKSMIQAIVKAKPQAAKGQYLKSISLSSTMGPGIKINPSQKY